MSRNNSNDPLIGPEWSKAPIIRESGGTRIREVKGLEALRREVSNKFMDCLANMRTETSRTTIHDTPPRSVSTSDYTFEKKG
jgi:hypothetical protein